MKTMATALLVSATLSVGAMSAPAVAAGGEGGTQQAQHASMQGKRMSHGEFAGEIIGVRTATFANGKSYELVKIRSKEGDVAVLNLGPVKYIKSNKINLQEGEYIMARGVSGRINGKPVLVVYSLRAGQSGNVQSGNQ